MFYHERTWGESIREAVWCQRNDFYLRYTNQPVPNKISEAPGHPMVGSLRGPERAFKRERQDDKGDESIPVDGNPKAMALVLIVL